MTIDTCNGSGMCAPLATQCLSTYGVPAYLDGACTTTSWARWPMPDPMPSAIPTSNYAVDSTDGVVTDNVTGLMWQEPIAPSTYTWGDAHCYCAGLSQAGHNDWRLPTVIELVSLVDETIVAPGPAINMTAFPSTPSAIFWTSSPVAGGTGYAWYVNFSFGSTGFFVVNNTYQVRCVR